MKKLFIAMLMFFITTTLQNCANRDENGNTDVNNTSATKNNTDGTRGGQLQKDSSVVDSSAN